LREHNRTVRHRTDEPRWSPGGGGVRFPGSDRVHKGDSRTDPDHLSVIGRAPELGGVDAAMGLRA
jgi:hypothetical protein